MSPRLAGDVATAAGRLAASGSSHEAATKLRASVAKTLVRSLGEMEGLPMKLGQFLSYMNDALPAEYREIYREALRELQAKSPAVRLGGNGRGDPQDLGDRAEDLIAAIDPVPIAVASIGQVYRADLVGGRVVAVKVQYPSIADAARSDLKNAETLRNALSLALGTFGAAANHGAGAFPVFVTSGEFNGDAKLDLAVANYVDNDVSVLLGNGDGTFAAAASYAVGDGPRSLASGDFDGDKKLDLAVPNKGATTSACFGARGTARSLSLLPTTASANQPGT
jgi:hypothetical protein